MNVLESALDTVSECAAAVPQHLHVEVCGFLRDFADRNYFDDRHALINDGRTIEERRQHYRTMRPHYELVTKEMLALFESG